MKVRRSAGVNKKQEETMWKWDIGSDQVSGVIRCLRMLASGALLIALTAAPAGAQYNSGSSGIHGAFPPAPVPTGGRYMLWDLTTGLLRFCSAYDTTARLDTCTTEVGTAQIPGIPAGGLTTRAMRRLRKAAGELEKNTELKKQLWISLRKLFGI